MQNIKTNKTVLRIMTPMSLSRNLMLLIVMNAGFEVLTAV
jgi:hypothetical protein